MHVHFEQNNSTRTECTILSLSWMGKVPEKLPENDGGWKLNRNQYYMEGWLASGNAKGVVGVSFTTSHCKKYDPPQRSNFNLRGHRSEVILVRWNEPYQKLATCDSQGVIFVWIKHEGRWSIELINDRNSQVTDFSWSHDGRMALICYCDGFVLVGSVAGQRYWSSMLNLDNTVITCGVWSPDDQKVMFGTTDGQIIVMSSTGAMLTQVIVSEGSEIASMSWSCEKFNMDESESKSNSSETAQATLSKEETGDHTLSVCFKNGAIYLMSNYDDICPKVIQTSLTGLKLDWSNCGEVLAVGGFVRLPNLQCRNELHFYNRDASLLHCVSVPSQGKPLTALCWGHNDRRLFIASGYSLFVAWITKQVVPLQFCCQLVIQKAIQQERNGHKLPLPSRLRHGIQALFSPTIKSYIPDPFKLREFVGSPPPGSERLYCTMVRHGEETSGGHYTLYLEYLGGLIPLLKGKRASKLRPDFVIFDPKIKPRSSLEDGTFVSEFEIDSSPSDSDEDIQTDVCGSPRMQRRKRSKTFRAEKVDRSITFRTLDELLYNDSLPESNRLLEVTANIWGTKFKITGLAPFLPEDLGHILYKTSLLHLQPRQMTVTITALQTVDQPLSRDPNFTPAGMSEDECDRFEDTYLNGHDLFQDEGILVVTETSVSDSHTKVTNHVVVDVLPSGNSASQVEEKMYSEMNGSFNVNNGSDRSYWSPNMKNRSLSPASESLAQNNAFNTEDNNLLKDKYISQGAKPKTQNMSHPGSSNEVSMATSVDEYAFQTTNSSSINGVNLRTSLHNEVESIMKEDDENRWADLANPGIKYIDEENMNDLPHENVTGLICDSSKLMPTVSDNHKRLYLASHLSNELDGEDSCKSCDHRGSVDSSATEEDNSIEVMRSTELLSEGEDFSNLLTAQGACFDICFNGYGDVVNKDSFTRKNSGIEISQSASLPASPIRGSKADSPTRRLREEVLRGKCKHYSPLFKRKSKHSHHSHALDSSEEDVSKSVEEIRYIQNYKNLESFQKAQFKQKLRRARSRSEDRTRFAPIGLRQFVMHNKAPLWNENSQVYQLDFGGRVTQESAKNFQIEFRGKQVMQFGRIDSNAYTLDFQYPFTALQAFAVALANVTQRLK